MPCVSAATMLLPTGDGQIQSNAALAFLHTQLIAAGFRELRRFSTGAPNRIYRYPRIDVHDTLPEYLVVYSSLGLVFENIYDLNVQALDAVLSSVPLSTGGFSGGTWPTTGAPYLGNATNDGTSYALPFSSGLDAYTLRVLASEYGVVVSTVSGGNGAGVVVERTVNSARIGRSIVLAGCLQSGTYPLTFAAPSGGIPVHLRFNVEGMVLDVTFPTGSPLSAFQIAREVTRQCGGILEAYVRRVVGGEDEVDVRIPLDRAPIGTLSTTRPQLALTYQDPTVFTARLAFNLGPRASLSWTIGSGTIRRTNFNFPLNKVRPGATVRNHTLNVATTVVEGIPFATTATQDDTLRLASTAGWLSSHVIEVYPGPETTSHGYSHHGGHWQCVLEGAETSNIAYGAVRTVILSDYYGEAQAQYEVGQTVIVANNGMCVTMTLSSVVGSFRRGEEVSFSGTSAKGRIRGINGSSVSIDVTENGVYTQPVVASSTITGSASGATATVASVEVLSDARTGWSTPVTITAIGQVDAAAGDYRTTLDLDFTAPHVNTAFVVGPGAVVGTRAKYLRAGVISYVGISLSTIPTLGGSDAVSVVDVHAQSYIGAPTPAEEPNWQTHSLQLTEILTRNKDESSGPYWHLRAVSARNNTVIVGDRIAEDMDVNRAWIAFCLVPGVYWTCMGPGGAP